MAPTKTATETITSAEHLSPLDSSINSAKKEIDVLSKRCGKDHASVGNRWMRLGSLFCKKQSKSGDVRYFDDALCAYREALSIRLTQEGADSVRVANTRYSIGMLLIDRLETKQKTRNPDATAQLADDPERNDEDANEAISQLSEALRIRKEQSGSYHIDTSNVMHGYGRALLAICQPDEAIDQFGTALESRCANLGRTNSLVAETLEQLGWAHHATSQKDKMEEQEQQYHAERSLQAFRCAVNIWCELVDDQNNNVSEPVSALRRLGPALLQLDDYESSLVIYEKLFSINDKDAAVESNAKTNQNKEKCTSSETNLSEKTKQDEIVSDLATIGAIRYRLGKPEQSVEAYLQAFQLLHSRFSKSSQSPENGSGTDRESMSDNGPLPSTDADVEKMIHALSTVAQIRWESQDYELAVLAIRMAGIVIDDATISAENGDRNQQNPSSTQRIEHKSGANMLNLRAGPETTLDTATADTKKRVANMGEASDILPIPFSGSDSLLGLTQPQNTTRDISFSDGTVPGPQEAEQNNAYENGPIGWLPLHQHLFFPGNVLSRQSSSPLPATSIPFANISTSIGQPDIASAILQRNAAFARLDSSASTASHENYPLVFSELNRMDSSSSNARHAPAAMIPSILSDKKNSSSPPVAPIRKDDEMHNSSLFPGFSTKAESFSAIPENTNHLDLLLASSQKMGGKGLWSTSLPSNSRKVVGTLPSPFK